MSEEQAIAAELTARVEDAGGLWHVAEKIGYDRRNLDRYMKGQSTPALPTLLKILAAMGDAGMPVDVPAFFAGVVRRVED